jgi:CelD/BcsL family acetyltransferase involved in cellulose biosynthesis
MPLSATPPAREADRGLSGNITLAHSAAARSTRALSLDLVTTRAEFDALEHEWNSLFARAGQGTQLFQTFNWLWHWCNHFVDGRSGARLSIVTARRHGKLVLVWPLVAERTGLVTRLSWMGEPVSQYGDVVMDDEAGGLDLLREAWVFLLMQTRASVVQLRRVRADAKVAPLMRELALIETEPLIAPYLDLRSAPSFEEYEKRYSNGSRKSRRRQRRRLEDHGPLSLAHYRGGATARDLALHAIELKRAWLRQRGLVSPALKDTRTARFFADVAAAEQRPAGCQVLALMSNGRPAALEVSISAKDRTAAHIIVYDPDLEKHSAGVVLMEDSIRQAYGERCAILDLMAPGDPYKLDWADASVGVATFTAPLTPVGWVHAKAHLAVRSSLKKALNLLPISMRRRLFG